MQQDGRRRGAYMLVLVLTRCSEVLLLQDGGCKGARCNECGMRTVGMRRVKSGVCERTFAKCDDGCMGVVLTLALRTGHKTWASRFTIRAGRRLFVLVVMGRWRVAMGSARARVLPEVRASPRGISGSLSRRSRWVTSPDAESWSSDGGSSACALIVCSPQAM